MIHDIPVVGQKFSVHDIVVFDQEVDKVVVVHSKADFEKYLAVMRSENYITNVHVVGHGDKFK